MPTTCAAFRCNSEGRKGNGIGFYSFPSAARDRLRRLAWIKAVRRESKDGRPWEPSRASRLCGKHFVSGSPSLSPRHPDYVPSVFAHTSGNEHRRSSALDRFLRQQQRSLNKKRSEHGDLRAAGCALHDENLQSVQANSTVAASVEGARPQSTAGKPPSEGAYEVDNSNPLTEYTAAPTGTANFSTEIGLVQRGSAEAGISAVRCSRPEASSLAVRLWEVLQARRSETAS
ncbi:uncharacterized protein LOC144145872 isoform X2 [Haemaphysalis longicornis]